MTHVRVSMIVNEKIINNLFTDKIISCDDTPQNRELLRIPLLKDVFERYPTTPINIDVKENNDELIRQVIRFLGKRRNIFSIIDHVSGDELQSHGFS
jgi:hypothetical protein